ncbi:MAG: YbjN domain-containing protein, partial [Acidimicrobiales bacterium]
HLWILRVAGEVKQAFAIWVRVDQRSLFYETNLVPAPPKEREAIFELLLRRNHTMRGAAFEIAAEGAIYVAGHIPLTQVNAETLDAMVGALYQYTEENFAAVLRLGFQ